MAFLFFEKLPRNLIEEPWRVFNSTYCLVMKCTEEEVCWSIWEMERWLLKNKKTWMKNNAALSADQFIFIG